MIMDEATSSVDFETDEAIQRGIRKELSGVTVLTIAHRLRSMYVLGCFFWRLPRLKLNSSLLTAAPTTTE